MKQNESEFIRSFNFSLPDLIPGEIEDDACVR